MALLKIIKYLFLKDQKQQLLKINLKENIAEIFNIQIMRLLLKIA